MVLIESDTLIDEITSKDQRKSEQTSIRGSSSANKGGVSDFAIWQNQKRNQEVSSYKEFSNDDMNAFFGGGKPYGHLDTAASDRSSHSQAQDRLYQLEQGGDTPTFRSVFSGDKQSLTDFYNTLSIETKLLRFGCNSENYSEQICSRDDKQNVTIVIHDQNNKIIGVGELIKATNGENAAELALVIADGFQRRGLGNKLLDKLIQKAHDKKFERITGQIEERNDKMITMVKKRGAIITECKEERVINFVMSNPFKDTAGGIRNSSL